MSKLKMFFLLFVLLSPALAFADCADGKYKDCRCSLAVNNGFQNVSDVTMAYCCDKGCGGMGYDGDPRCCSQGTTWDSATKTCKSACTNSYGSWISVSSSVSDTCNNDRTNEYTCAAGARTCNDVKNYAETTAWSVSGAKDGTITGSYGSFQAACNTVTGKQPPAYGYMGAWGQQLKAASSVTAADCASANQEGLLCWVKTNATNTSFPYGIVTCTKGTAYSAQQRSVTCC